MAIVFISAERKQRMFFWALALISLVVLAGITFLVFLPELTNQAPAAVAPGFKPLITVNADILDSSEVTSLEAVPDLPGLEGVQVGRPNPFISY